MALKGTFYGTTDNEYIRPKIVWSATQSLTGNYSTVTATLYYSRTNSGYTTKGTGSFSLTINGNKASVSKAVTITKDSNTLAITHKVQVTHSANGSKSITISAAGSISGTSLGSTSISSTVTLDTIPRATTPTLSASSVNMGSTVTINTPRASSSFTHDLAYKFAGSGWIDIRTGVGTSYTWTVPNLSGFIPDAASGTLSIRCITKNGSTTIGTKTISMTVKVPNTADYGPTISSVVVTEATSGLAAQFGAFIQNKSTLKVVVTASGRSGSTIKSYSTTFLGVTYKTASFTTGAVSKSGTLSLVTTVTDSRGRTAKKTTTISVLAYSLPKIKTLTADRYTLGSDQVHTLDPSGNKVIIYFDYNSPSLRGSSAFDGNTLTLKVSYKRTTGTDWTTDSEIKNVVLTQATSITIDDELSADYQYDVRLELTDYFGAKTSAVVVVPSAKVIADIKANGKGLGIGKTAELDDTVDVAWNTLLRGGASKPVNLLWDASTATTTNGWYMTDASSQTVKLSQKISEQLTGVVFAWSAYDSTTSKGVNRDWHFFFVPKSHNFTQGNNGVWMCDAYLGLRKYVYIYDDQVLGHPNNNQATATNGISFDNSKYVLRYIAGV